MDEYRPERHVCVLVPVDEGIALLPGVILSRTGDTVEVLVYDLEGTPKRMPPDEVKYLNPFEAADQEDKRWSYSGNLFIYTVQLDENGESVYLSLFTQAIQDQLAGHPRGLLITPSLEDAPEVGGGRRESRREAGRRKEAG